MVDIDGVISLFAGGLDAANANGSFHSIEGIPHFLSATAAAHLLALRDRFELVWASGWEERANEHLPHLLGLPGDIPFLSFERTIGRGNAHWKLDAIERHAGERPLAWIDDALDERCERWAAERATPTLLVHTEPSVGLTDREAELLIRWAGSLATA
jgi:HAD domain in Swiss Army Knife RNA repair proteins